MDVRVEHLGSYLRKVSYVIAASEVEQVFQKATREVVKKTNLPGFRPGKVPKALIERQFGSEIAMTVHNKLVEATLFAGMEQEDVEPVAMPKVEIGELTRGKTYAYSAEVEVRPTISLKRYDGFQIPARKTQVDTGHVDEQLEKLRADAAETVPVVGRNDVQPGDLVLLDYDGSIEGVPFEGGKAQGALVETENSQYIPGFAEGLIGATVPGVIDVPVTFPADYGAEHLAGKIANFKMTLSELKMREKPALDDEFAKDKGHDSLTALRASVEKDLSRKLDETEERGERQAVLKALVQENPFELPPSMVDSQVERMVEGAAERLERMTGQKVPTDDPILADLRGSSREEAEFQVRAGLLLMEVGKKEDVAISKEDIDQEIERIAIAAGKQADLARAAYSEVDRREELRFRLLEQKVIALLVKRGQVIAA